jgi:hypothetical protein
MPAPSRPAATSNNPFASNFNAKLEQYQQQQQQSNALNSSRKNLNTSSESNKSSAHEGVFSGRSFQIIGFDETEAKGLANVLKQKGAKSASYLESDLANYSSSSLRKREYVDYTLFPQTIPAPTSNNNPVTVFWMVKINFYQQLLL